MSAAFTKLRDGSWGIRVTGDKPAPGAQVVVGKKDGTSETKIVSKVLWSDPYGAVHLCAVAQDYKKAYAGGGWSRRSRCVTGGNCSSFGDGRSCGASDCDGY